MKSVRSPLALLGILLLAACGSSSDPRVTSLTRRRRPRAGSSPTRTLISTASRRSGSPRPSRTCASPMATPLTEARSSREWMRLLASWARLTTIRRRGATDPGTFSTTRVSRAPAISAVPIAPRGRPPRVSSSPAAGDAIATSSSGRGAARLAATEAEIQSYLDRMAALERDFPTVRFVYMTGHLDGSGANGSVHKRNEQIRSFCRSNGKILYDFADIESWDPEGKTHYLPMGRTTAATTRRGTGRSSGSNPIPRRTRHSGPLVRFLRP